MIFTFPIKSFSFANYFSKRSRSYTGKNDETFTKKENEWLYQFCTEKLKIKHHDYFIFGHRHMPLEVTLNNNAKYFNLGDWISYYSYAKFDGISVELKYFKKLSDK